jgi:hypothetical protein
MKSEWERKCHCSDCERFAPAVRRPIRAQWISRITEFEWNHHLCDVQTRDRSKRGITVISLFGTCRDSIDGTLVADVVSYEVGFGVIGELTNRFFISQ